MTISDDIASKRMGLDTKSQLSYFQPLIQIKQKRQPLSRLSPSAVGESRAAVGKVRIIKHLCDRKMQLGVK